MQTTINFDIDWNLIKFRHLQLELLRTETKLNKALNSVRTYKGWKKRRKNLEIKK